MKIHHHLSGKHTPPHPPNPQEDSSKPNDGSKLAKSQLNLVSSIEDVVNLSSEGLEKFAQSQSLQDAVSVTINRSSQSLDHSNSDHAIELRLTGNKNTVKGSLESDLLQVTGNQNKITDQKGDNQIYLDGDSNEISLASGKNQVVILGDTNRYESLSDEKENIVIKGSNNIFQSSGEQDTYLLSGNQNRIQSGNGDDLIYQIGNNNVIQSEDGDDVIISEGSAQSIRGGSGDDTISANGSGNIYGNEGNDYIEIKGTSNSVYGGDGNDIIKVYDSSNQVYAGKGNDTIDLQLAKGVAEIDGGKGIDTLKVNFSLKDYTVSYENDVARFYSHQDAKVSIELNLKDVENIKFSDDSTIALSELSSQQGLAVEFQEIASNTYYKNSNNAVNAVNIDLNQYQITQISNTVNGIKINYQTENKSTSLQLDGIRFLNLGSSGTLDTTKGAQLDYVNIPLNDSIVVTKQTSSNTYLAKFYSAETEQLILSKELPTTKHNLLFSDNTLVSIEDFLSQYTGKTTEITPSAENEEITPENDLVNVAEVSIASKDITSIRQNSNQQFTLNYLEGGNTKSLKLNQFQFIKTKEGDTLNLASVASIGSNIRKEEKSHPVYQEALTNTEFIRAAYQLTQNDAYLSPHIDGEFDTLTEEQQNTVKEKATNLATSINFTSDAHQNTVDDATKRLISLRVANLLRGRDDVLETLQNAGITLHFSGNKDFGGNASSFVSGFAGYNTDSDEAEYSVSLAYSTFYGGVYDGDDGDTVGLHEIVHVLDFLKSETGGIPTGASQETESNLNSVRENLFAEYAKSQSEIGILREYAFTNEYEFLSVASENFYEKPVDLNNTSKELYDVLKTYFNV